MPSIESVQARKALRQYGRDQDAVVLEEGDPGKVKTKSKPAEAICVGNCAAKPTTDAVPRQVEKDPLSAISPSSKPKSKSISCNALRFQQDYRKTLKTSKATRGGASLSMQAACPIPLQCSCAIPSQGYPGTNGPAPMQWGYLQPIPVNFLPPGTIPIPVQDLGAQGVDRTAICPFNVAEQYARVTVHNPTWAAMTSSAVPTAIPTSTFSSFQGAPVDPCQEPRHEGNVSAINDKIAHEGAEASESGSSSSTTSQKSATIEPMYETARERLSCTTAGYEEQMAERRRLEAQDAERERLEEEKIKLEEEERARREADDERRRREEKRIKEQEKEKVRRTLEEALERAKLEAEITRKARVFKHVLEGAEKTPELERRLLGVDPETGDRILNEVSHLERQMKIEREVIDKKPTPKQNERREKSPIVKRTAPKSRRSSLSEAHVAPEVRNQGKIPLVKKQTASTYPVKSTDDRVEVHSYEHSVSQHPLCPPSASTPLRRFTPGRMSVRVTRKEKDLSAESEHFSRSGFTQSTMRSSHTLAPLSRDQGVPPSKIPIATPIASAPRSGRPPALPPQPFKVTNRLPAVESEAELSKSERVDIARPRNLAQLEDLNDNPLFSPVATRHRRSNKMRGLSDSPVNVDSSGSSGVSTEDNHDANSNSSASPHQHWTSFDSPVPAIVTNNDADSPTKSILLSNNNDLKIRSALSSPAAYLNQTPRCSTYVKRLVEKGCNKSGDMDVLSPDVRRKAEANLSRASSIQSLRGSLGNLAGWRGSVSNLTEDSPNMNRFKSLNPNYRSFNAKKNVEKQQEVIDRLSRLRDSLRSRENFVERGLLPKHQAGTPTTVVKT